MFYVVNVDKIYSMKYFPLANEIESKGISWQWLCYWLKD